MNLSLIEKVKNTNLPVIIFGAGIVGEVLYKACAEADINIDCFCDNNLNKTKEKLFDKKIMHTSELAEKYKDANFLISAADINDVVLQLDFLGYKNWNSCSDLLKGFNFSKFKFSTTIEDFIDYAVSTCILCQENYLNPNKLFLRSVDLIVTEKCSLKCAGCSNLMQYYEKPVDCDSGTLIETIDKFFSIIDEINEFRILGGEPFMNKEVHVPIKRLINEEKVKKIVVYTNGTIIPRDEQLKIFEDEKMFFIVTDYSKLSRNLENLVKKLEDNGISYFVQKAGRWTDCASLEKHYRNIEGQEKIFKDCCAKNTFTLSEGNLYRCPFSANAVRLKAIPVLRGDYINIFDTEKEISQIKSEIREFLFQKKFLETCDYCNGRSFGDPEIEPAIQIKKPLIYKKY